MRQIDAYEAALVAGEADLMTSIVFCPPTDETRHAEMLVELLRISLEHRFNRARSVR